MMKDFFVGKRLGLGLFLLLGLGLVWGGQWWRTGWLAEAEGGENTAVIQTTHYTVTPDNQVVVAIEATNLPAEGIGAMSVSVSYDPAILTIASCTVDPNNVLDSGFCNPNFASNTVRFNGIAVQGTTADSVLLANVVFTAVGNPNSTSPLTITSHTLTATDGATIPHQSANGSINIPGTNPAPTLYLPLITR
jgi:hypothetical protein